MSMIRPDKKNRVINKKTIRTNFSSKFTNPILKMWIKDQGNFDFEYMFEKLGNWPEKYMIEHPFKNRNAKIMKKSPEKNYASKQISHKKKFSTFSNPIKKPEPDPWIFQPALNSLLYPVKKI